MSNKKSRPERRAGGPKVDDREPVLRVYFGEDEIHVDLFAGGGGASVGAALATGRSPDVAVNHSPVAIAMHRANHPTTRHYIEDVYEVDPRVATRGRQVALLWLSPTCTHHSKAKGAALVDRKIRGLCWSALPWIKHCRPRVIILENVEEFAKWGPLHRQHTDGCEGVKCAKGCRFGTMPKNRRGKGRIKHHDKGCPGVECSSRCRIDRPIKAREAETFNAFVAKIRSKGYSVEWKFLRACDYGAPTTRRRLYMVMRADGQPASWPEVTHGPGLVPYRTAAECIDWSIPCPSIFDRERALADKTMARIARGVRKFVMESERPFIVPVNHGGVGRRDLRVHDSAAPMPTITGGQRGGHAVVVPIVTKAKTHGGGNGVHSGAEPLGTVTASKRGEFALASATLVRAGATGNFLVSPVVVPATHGDSRGQPDSRTHGVDEPLRTITTLGAQFSIASAVLVRTAHGDVDASGKRRGPGEHTVEAPLGTVCAGGTDHAIAAAYMVHRSNGERPGQAPRVYDVEDPHPTVVAEGLKTAVCAAFLAKHNGGSHESKKGGQAVTAPADTISAQDQKAVTVAHLVRYNSENSAASARGQSADTPVSTLDTANRVAVATSHLMKLRGTSPAHVASSSQAVDAPAPTISAEGTHVAEVRAFLVRYNGQSGPQNVDAPLGTLDATDRYGLATVVIGGELYEIVDIGMRMLTPRELFAAQGFPPTYQIDPVGPKGKRLTKTEQIRACGNSVCPPVARALVEAQFAPQRTVAA